MISGSKRSVANTLESYCRYKTRYRTRYRTRRDEIRKKGSARADADDEMFSKINASDSDSGSKKSTWRPAPPDIKQSSAREFSAISYALLGDSVWELFVRAYLFAPRTKPSQYDLRVKLLARAEAQAFVYRKIVNDTNEKTSRSQSTKFFALSEEELQICKWGRNADYSNVPKRLRGKKTGGHDIYRQASALEVILGWWMVTDDERLDECLAFVRDDTAWLEDALSSNTNNTNIDDDNDDDNE